MLNFHIPENLFLQYGVIDILHAKWAMKWRVFEIKNMMEYYIIWGKRGVEVTHA